MDKKHRGVALFRGRQEKKQAFGNEPATGSQQQVSAVSPKNSKPKKKLMLAALIAAVFCAGTGVTLVVIKFQNAVDPPSIPANRPVLQSSLDNGGGNNVSQTSEAAVETHSFDPSTQTLTILSDTYFDSDYEHFIGSPDEPSDLVKTVVIKDGVTQIGRYAFYNCSALTSSR